MTLTNRHNLPEVFARYERGHQHNSGGAEYTITTLIDSPQIARLKKNHHKEITEDLSDRVWAIFGTAIHEILESGAGDGEIPEERFHATINGISVSGQVDLQVPVPSGTVLVDYKTIRAYTIQANPEGKPEWENQLNCYAHLARQNFVDVAGLEVVAICRDWNQAAADRSEDYPVSPIVRVPVDLWEPQRAGEYMEARVSLHGAHEPIECTDQEMWVSPPVFAVHETKGDGTLKKRAKKLFANRTDAEIYVMESPGGRAPLEIVERERKHTRCDSYCSVSEWCEQNHRRKSND